MSRWRRQRRVRDRAGVPLGVMLIGGVLTAAACGDDGAGNAGASADAAPTTTADDSATTAEDASGAGQGDGQEATGESGDAGEEVVVVELTEEWAPSSELSPAEQEAQDARVEAAKDEVLALVGDEGRLRRPEDRLSSLGIPAVILSVTPEGRSLLEESDLVDQLRAPDDIELRDEETER